MALGFILTGYYLNLLVFTSLILVHEFGHYITAKILGFNVVKIIIYPYGGLTKIEDLINQKIDKELLVAVSGIIYQTIFFLLIMSFTNMGIIREYTYRLFYEYNKELLLFNLLPIYPLDGAKIVKLVLEKISPYCISNSMIIIISLITIIGLIFFQIYQKNYSYFMIITILLNYLYGFYKNLKYLYHKFLLERYLYHIKYSNKKIIHDPKKMYKNSTHIIKKGTKYQKEDEFLNNMFDLQKKI
jgi:stage IV sporulation protein FB